MDNLTHSLVGLLCAEVVIRVAERRRPLGDSLRRTIYTLSIVGNNLPDLDFTYSRVSGKTFGYLLHHRGYTHTVPAAFAFALAMMAVVVGWSRWRRSALSGSDLRLLSGVALVSPLLHIAMDLGNNYGVHPFWPIYDGWLYGDSFFIVEPSFWLVLIAPLSFSIKSKPIRAALWLMLGVALGALWYKPFVPRAHAALLSAITGVLLVVARRQSPFARMALAGSGFVLLAAAFVLGSRLAKRAVRESAASAWPGASTLDIVATPMPANPFCWSVILVEEDGEKYLVRLARAAVLPLWLDVEACPYDRDANPTTPLRALDIRGDGRLRWSAEYRVPSAQLRELADARCEVRALLRFARVPYFTELAPDGTRIVGDVRYDRNPDLDFSDIRLSPSPSACPDHVPPWRPPRSDLLSR